jgi:hypothetical protein
MGYAQPAPQPARKSSTWKIVLGVVAVLLLCSLGGCVLFVGGIFGAVGSAMKTSSSIAVGSTVEGIYAGVLGTSRVNGVSAAGLRIKLDSGETVTVLYSSDKTLLGDGLAAGENADGYLTPSPKNVRVRITISTDADRHAALINLVP